MVDGKTYEGTEETLKKMDTKNIIIAKFNARREGNIKAIHTYNEGFTNDSALWIKSMMEWMVSEDGCKVWDRTEDIYDLMTAASEALASLMNPTALASANATLRREEEIESANRYARNKSIKTYSNY